MHSCRNYMKTQSVMDAAGPLTLADTSSKIKKGKKREATPLLPTAPAILDYATDAVRKKRTRQSHEGLKFAFTSKDLHDEYAIEKHNKTAKENAELALQDFDTVNERNVKEDGSESVGSKSYSIGIASDRSFGIAREDDCGSSCDKGNHRVGSSVALKSDSPGLS